jgi:hypothetical protein
MKTRRMILISALAGIMSVLGCGDDGGGGSNGGNGNGASGVCARCDVPALSGECERAYNLCIEEDAGGSEECAVVGLSECGA